MRAPVLRGSSEVPVEELGAPLRAVHAEQREVLVAGRPGIEEDLEPFVDLVQAGLERVESFSQRQAPGLVPAVATFSRRASAVRAPALDPVRTAPGAPLAEPGLPARRVRLEVRAEVRDLDVAFLGQPVEHPGHRHFAEAAVVAEGLAVDADGQELVFRGAAVEGAPHAGQQIGAVAQRPLEGDRAGQPTVVEEQHDLLPARQAAQVGPRGVHVSVQVAPRVAAQGTHGLGLVGRQDRVAEPRRGEVFERGGIDRGLGEPHAFGGPAEARAEVLDAPTDLRHAVPRARQRHDDVVVDLRQRVAEANDAPDCADRPDGSPRRLRAWRSPSTRAGSGRS